MHPDQSYRNFFASSRGLMILSFILTIAALFYRRPDAFYAAQFWAEEGAVFYAEARQQGFGSLFNTCVGYFHFYPRLVSCISAGAGLPLQAVPFLFSYAWLLALLVLLFYIWKRLAFTPLQLFFISLTVVLIPLQSEVFMNLTNVQWIMAVFPIIIFSSENTSRGWFIADLVVLFFAGMTGPNFTVLLPLFIFLFFYRKREIFSDKKKLILVALSILFAIAGIFALSRYGSVNRTSGVFDFTNPGFVQLIFIQYMFPFIGKFATHTPFMIMLPVVVGIAAGFFCLIRNVIRKSNNRFETIILISGILYLCTTLVAYRNDPGMLSPYYRGVRNFYIPAITFIWLLIRFFETKKSGRTILALLMISFSVQLVLFVGTMRLKQYDLSAYNEKLKTADTLSVPANPEPWIIFIDKSREQNSSSE